MQDNVRRQLDLLLQGSDLLLPPLHSALPVRPLRSTQREDRELAQGRRDGELEREGDDVLRRGNSFFSVSGEAGVIICTRSKRRETIASA
jgi:hypothetical protein